MSIVVPDFFPTSAFGEMAVSQLTQQCGWSFTNTVNPATVFIEETSGGTVTHTAPLVELNSGITVGGTAHIHTYKPLKYNNGQGAVCFFTGVYDTRVAGNTQMIGVGDFDNGFFFGYNHDETEFGILHRNGGVETFIAQSAWDNSPFAGFDPEKGNVYKIQYQWLGFGGICFFVENKENAHFDLVHLIKYPNTAVIPSTESGVMPIHAECVNVTATTDVQLKTSSAGGFIEGNVNIIGARFAVDNDLSLATQDGEYTAIIIRNEATFNSILNRNPILTDLISISTEGSKATKFRVWGNPTFSATPTWTDVATGMSTVSYATDKLQITAGALVAPLRLSSGSFDTLQSDNFELLAGQVMAITAESGSAAEVGCGLSWREHQ